MITFLPNIPVQRNEETDGYLPSFIPNELSGQGAYQQNRDSMELQLAAVLSNDVARRAMVKSATDIYRLLTSPNREGYWGEYKAPKEIRIPSFEDLVDEARKRPKEPGGMRMGERKVLNWEDIKKMIDEDNAKKTKEADARYVREQELTRERVNKSLEAKKTQGKVRAHWEAAKSTAGVYRKKIIKAIAKTVPRVDKFARMAGAAAPWTLPAETVFNNALIPVWMQKDNLDGGMRPIDPNDMPPAAFYGP